MHKRFSRGLFTLRFKQWSRKSYAAFKSIGRQVTIGALKAITADTLLGKQKNILSVFTIAWKEKNDFYEDEEHDPPDEILLKELFFLPGLKLQRTYCGVVISTIQKENLCMAESCCSQRFQPFLLLCERLSFT